MTAQPPSGLFDSLFDSDGTIFMGSRRNPADCRVGLFGVPYDGTTSFRPGTRFGPAAIREVSAGLETYCPQLNLDLDDLDFADLGAVDLVDFQREEVGLSDQGDFFGGVVVAGDDDLFRDDS